MDNVLSATRSYSGVTPQTFTYSYNPDGSRNTLGTSAGTFTYGYDPVGRYTSMGGPLGTVSSEYFMNGWQSKRTLPSGGKTEYTYNSLGLLTSLINKNSAGTPLSNYVVDPVEGYDGTFNLHKWSQTVTPPGSGGAGATYQGTTTYTYDGGIFGSGNKDRLTQETSTRFNNYTEDNVYDTAGNPTTFRNTSGKTYNENNQITGSLFAYDGNGNSVQHNGVTLTYDEENRLTAYGSVQTNGYRADGLRAWTQYGSSQPKVYYFYDGGNAVLATTANGTQVELNMFAPDGLVKRQYTAPSNNPLVQGHAYVGEYFFDWQGNAVHILQPSLQVGGTGTLIHSAYNAWGQKNFLYPSSSNVNLHVFGYNARWGYRTDTQTGLFYCQNRYYSASDGRWLNRDPIGYSGGTNLYGYCGNGPVGGMDSSGLRGALLPLVETAPEAEAVSLGASTAAGTATVSGGVVAVAVVVAAVAGAEIGAAIDDATDGTWGKCWGHVLGVDVDGQTETPPLPPQMTKKGTHYKKKKWLDLVEELQKDFRTSPDSEEECEDDMIDCLKRVNFLYKRGLISKRDAVRLRIVCEQGYSNCKGRLP